MKNSFVKITLLAAVLFGFAFGNSQNANAQNALQGVKINGVTWATTNLGATTPEGNGNYYAWEDAITACPNGWRIPTLNELKTLLDAEKVDYQWTTENGVNGYRFMENGNGIFMSAAGYRDFDADTLHDAGKIGNYWSNTKYENYGLNAYRLYFYVEDEGAFYTSKAYGLSVRCVAE